MDAGQKQTIRGKRKNPNKKSKTTQVQAQVQGQVLDLERVTAINSLDSWRAPSMDATTDSGRNNRRGNESLPSNPQRRPSGVNSAQQNRKSGKPNQNVIKSVAVPQNGPPATQSTTENTIPIPIVTEAVSDQPLMPVFGCDVNAPTYKPDLKGGESKTNSKPGIMANGKDFWLELRKQVAALQQSGGTAQGG